MASTALAAALVADSDNAVLSASRVLDRAVPLSPSSIHNAPVPAPPLNDMAILTFSSFIGCTVSARPPRASSTLGRANPEPADALALPPTSGSGLGDPSRSQLAAQLPPRIGGSTVILT